MRKAALKKGGDNKLWRNKHIKIREEQKYEDVLIDKCGEQPKPFYRYMNKKLIHKERDEKYEKPKEISELLNMSF